MGEEEGGRQSQRKRLRERDGKRELGRESEMWRSLLMVSVAAIGGRRRTNAGLCRWSQVEGIR